MHKFLAKPKKADGIHFPSTLEENTYQLLKELQEKGRILFFLRQIPFDLPGNTKHRVDYLVFTPTDTLFIEAKGRDLGIGKMKRKQVEELYPVKIHLIAHPNQVLHLLDSQEGAKPPPI